MVGFWGEGEPEYPEKASRCREENHQTQSTYDARSGNRTWATLVGGECSHHCAIPAPRDEANRIGQVCEGTETSKNWETTETWEIKGTSIWSKRKSRGNGCFKWRKQWDLQPWHASTDTLLRCRDQWGTLQKSAVSVIRHSGKHVKARGDDLRLMVAILKFLFSRRFSTVLDVTTKAMKQRNYEVKRENVAFRWKPSLAKLYGEFLHRGPFGPWVLCDLTCFPFLGCGKKS